MDGGDSRYRRRGILAAGAMALAGCIEDDSGTGETETGGEDADQNGDQTAETERIPDGAAATPVRGDPDGSVTLEVYADLLCPACATSALRVMPGLLDAFEEVRFEHRDYPIPVVDGASQAAANAARAVYAEHGDETFWTYLEGLYQRQEELDGDTASVCGSVAADLDLDPDPIETAAQDRSHADAVAADRDRGAAIGIPGTPGFVLEGEVLEVFDGAESWEEIEARLEGRLDEAT